MYNIFFKSTGSNCYVFKPSLYVPSQVVSLQYMKVLTNEININALACYIL